MKKLEDYTEEELEKALTAKRQSRPELSSVINWNRIKDVAIERRDSVAEKGRIPKDFNHFLMETVMMEIFGKSYFRWENKYNQEG